MTEQFKILAIEAGLIAPHGSDREGLQDFDYRLFGNLIVKQCVTQCDLVAADANTMAKSKFMTDAGRLLHEGMRGGANNCTVQILTHFGVEL